MIIWGYLLKLCLADNAALFAKPHFDNPQLFTSISLILAVVTFALQIYGDFAGYSLIAIGLAHIMGYDFPMNFNKPYFSVSLSEFWSRWHITLGKWFRDYVFLPTAYALSRRLKDERYFGLKTEHWIYTISTLLTMVLVGLWHGSSWNFIFWGFLHGTYLSIQRWGTKPARRIRRKIHCPKFVSNPIAAIFVFSLVCISWIFFRSISMANAIYTLKSIFSWQTTAHLSFGGMKFQLLRIGFVACIVMIVDLLGSRKSSSAWIETHVYLRVISAAFAVLVILFTGNFASNSFIYFQF